jgi:hypothetical protein
MKKISAQEGIVSLGYDTDEFGEFARLYQFSKAYLFTPSSGLYSCPLAMTDGAAKTIQVKRCYIQELHPFAFVELSNYVTGTLFCRFLLVFDLLI